MTHARTLRTAGLLAALGLLAAAALAPSAAATAEPGWRHVGPAASVAQAGPPTEGSDVAPAADDLPDGALDVPTVDPSPVPAASPSPTQPNQPGDGEISIDGPFITPTPPATPVGAVPGASGVPKLTPPPTDTGTRASTTAGGFQILLMALAGLSALPLLVRRPPVTRRS